MAEFSTVCIAVDQNVIAALHRDAASCLQLAVFTEPVDPDAVVTAAERERMAARYELLAAAAPRLFAEADRRQACALRVATEAAREA